MKKIHVFTSAACNYIPKVRVLVESIRKWHPDWVIHLALSDEIPSDIDLSSEPFDEIHPGSTLGIPDFIGWSFCHSIVELSTAIKPFMLKKLLDRDDCAGVIYLDPDTVVFSPLDEVLQAITHSNIALTPHQIMPEKTLSAIMDNEIASLKHGIYNLGFVAVSATQIGKDFASFWAERIYYFCRDEIHNGLFTDQRWIDLVPAFFEGVCVLRSSRLNVAPWNITTRSITGEAPFDVKVDETPLGFYHFTGFDSGAHKTMANKNATGNSTVSRLIQWYLDTTLDLSKDPLSSVPWNFGCYTDGTKINKIDRFIYRERLDLQHAFPNPFDCTTSSGYKGWLTSQGLLEYPKLFIESEVKTEMVRLSSALTPGFQAGVSNGNMDFNLFKSHVIDAIKDPSSGIKLARRALSIVRTEGFNGIRKRLTKD
jgi:hypothetical protein